MLDTLEFHASRIIEVMKRFMLICTILALAAVTTYGGDMNAVGIWKWSLAGQNGETILKLNQDGETLTGTYTNLPGAASPYTNPITGFPAYFRLKSN